MFCMQRQLLLVIGIMVISGSIATAGENLFPQGDFGRAEFPGQWSFDQSWMSSRYQLHGEGAGAFVRVNEPPARMDSRFDLPDGVKKLELAARARQIDFKQGDKPWDVPTIVLNFVDNAGKEISSGWPLTIKFRGGDDWKINKQTYDVPDNAAKGKVDVSYKGSGDLDIDWIKVFDPADPAKLSADAPADAKADQPARRRAKAPEPAGPTIAPPADADQVDQGIVLYEGLAGKIGRMPEGWKTRLAGKQIGQAELVKGEDGDVIMRTSELPFQASYDAWMDTSLPTRVKLKVRVTGVAGLPKDKMPNISFVHAAVGGLEAGFAGNWIAEGDTDGWVEIDREFDAPRGIVRRMRIVVACPGDRGTVDIKDVKVIGFPERLKEKPDMSAVLGPNRQRREVDPSVITGSDIDESKIKITIHVDNDHPNANDLNTGVDRNQPKKSIQSAVDDFRMQHSGFTGATKILIHPGVYRPARTITIDNLMYATRKQLLVLEGAEAGKVVITGSITEGFEPGTWELVDRQRRIYRHDWPYDWGLVNRGYYFTADIVTHRREMIALNGELMTPKILEGYNYVDKRGREYNEVGLLVSEGNPKGKPGYDYTGFLELDALEPGEFGVAERSDHDRGDSLYLRLPAGMTELDGALVEVAYLPTLLRVRDKHNFVMRNLTFKHAASWYINYFDSNAVEIGPTPLAQSKSHELNLQPQNYLIEDCVFEDNVASGLSIRSMHNFDMRRCVFRNNGGTGLGMNHVRNGILEEIESTLNNRLGHIGGQEDVPHGGAGLNMSGMDLIFRNVNSHHNYGGGLRGDVIATNVIFENCKFNHNQNRAMFHEISWGPILFKNCQMIGTRATRRGMAHGLFLLNVRDVTVDNCQIANNQGYQISVNHSTSRSTVGHFYEDGLNVPIPTSKGFRIINSTVYTELEGDAAKIIARKGASAEEYANFVESEWEGRDNRYWSTDPRAFDADGRYHNRTWTDLAGWKQATGSEEGSIWSKSQ